MASSAVHRELKQRYRANDRFASGADAPEDVSPTDFRCRDATHETGGKAQERPGGLSSYLIGIPTMSLRREVIRLGDGLQTLGQRGTTLVRICNRSEKEKEGERHEWDDAGPYSVDNSDA